jgi:hypothetical protein
MQGGGDEIRELTLFFPIPDALYGWMHPIAISLTEVIAIAARGGRRLAMNQRVEAAVAALLGAALLVWASLAWGRGKGNAR